MTELNLLLEQSRRDFIEACMMLRFALKRLVDLMMLDDTQLFIITEAVEYHELAMADGDKKAQLAIRALAIENFKQGLDQFAVPRDEIAPLVELLIDSLDTAATLSATARALTNAAPKGDLPS